MRAPTNWQRRLAPVAALVVGLMSPFARADAVLHEYVVADPADDLKLGATSSDGNMAAAIETQSGPVSSPDINGPADPHDAVYGAQRTGRGSGGSFRIDRDTTRPSVVSYDNPFTPAVAPYKREFAYDTIDDALALVVRDPSLQRLAIGGAPRAEDDQFYADIEVDLTAGEATRIPTVGPAARLLALRSVPSVAMQVFKDSAENWFVKGDRTGRARVVMHVAVDRSVFGSPFADVEWPRLYRSVPPLSDRAKTEGVRVARQIGVVDGTGPAEALRILVRHFRKFAPSNDRPKSTGIDLYRELAVTKKGVCRHRSYAFAVTALALGIPTRFVRNEAHAWVEVFDGTRWHRVDLGGAADRLDSPDTARIAHIPPRDPFEWPPGADSGQAMADRSRAAQGIRRNPAHAGEPAAPVATSAPDAHPDAEDKRPHSVVVLSVNGAEARRGSRLRISGRVESAGAPCAELRVNLYLEPKGPATKERIPLGTLVTNAEGRYDGRVVVPYAVSPGDYDVRASTPGNQTCGDGFSM